jgi:hypothetical protein
MILTALNIFLTWRENNKDSSTHGSHGTEASGTSHSTQGTGAGSSTHHVQGTTSGAGSSTHHAQGTAASAAQSTHASSSSRSAHGYSTGLHPTSTQRTQTTSSHGGQLRAADVLKVLVLWAQYLVIIVKLPVQWPSAIGAIVEKGTWLFAAATGWLTPFDCVLQQSAILPSAVLKQLVNLLVPLFVAFVMLACFVPRVQQCHLLFKWHKVPVVLLVVAYYFFPSFVKQSLSWYACYPIDDPVLMQTRQMPYTEYATANAPHGYWTLDMQQPCWEGWHRDWGWGLGFPCVIIFCFGAPAAVFMVLWTNKSNLMQRQFKQHFGFLYHNYSDSRW